MKTETFRWPYLYNPEPSELKFYQSEGYIPICSLFVHGLLGTLPKQIKVSVTQKNPRKPSWKRIDVKHDPERNKYFMGSNEVDLIPFQIRELQSVGIDTENSFWIRIVAA